MIWLISVGLVLVLVVVAASRATLAAELARAVAALPRAPSAHRPVSEAQLAALPPPVRRYLEVTGAAAQPRPFRLRARFHGRIRADASSAWMPFTGEQHSVLEDARGPTRVFFMAATMHGLPVQVLHRYEAGHASMRVRLFGLVPITRAAGDAMTRAETVTLLNDACLLAPGAILDPAMRWEPIDAHRACATYTNAGHTVSAIVSFGDDGMIADFVSDDRARIQNGVATACRWSTPMRDVRTFGPLRLASYGEGRYHPPEGAFTYLELKLDDVALEPAA